MLPPEQVKYIDDLMRSDLLYWRELWFGWLLLSTKLVVGGLILEGPELVCELKSIRRRVRIEKSGMSLQESHTPDWVKIVALLGWLFIVVGVAGEWITDAWISEAESNIQAFNNILLAETTKEAGDAKTSAARAKTSADAAGAAADKTKEKVEAVSKQAAALTLRLESAARELGELGHDVIAQGPRAKLLIKAEPELVRQLVPFAGQRVKLFVCGQPGKPESADQETRDTWGEIGFILGKDGAKWKPTGLGSASPFVECGIGRGAGGQLTVLVSKVASERTAKAAKALYDGFNKALPIPGVQLEEVGSEFREEEHESASPWRSVAMDTDLITVLVGAHPQP